LRLAELEARLPLKARSAGDAEGIEFLVVDDCEDEAASRFVREFCEERGWTHIRTAQRSAVFNLSACRNIGIRAARAEHILFEDLDVLHPSDFYGRMLGYARAPRATFHNFVTVPVAYLQPGPTAEIEAGRIDIDGAVMRVREAMLSAHFDDAGRVRNAVIESFAPASAILLVRRSILFGVGLFDERFEGWGGEDRDLVLRLLAFNNRIAAGDDLGVTSRTNMSRMRRYSGWRSLFAMHGDHFIEQGLLSVHLHHAERAWKDPQGRRRNMALAASKAKRFAAAMLTTIAPEVDPGRPASFIVGRNPHLLNGDLFALFGNVGIIEEEWTPDEALAHLARHQVERILVWNEQARPRRKALWDAFVASGYRVLCVERGALPGTYYFDPSGFCVTGTSYRRELWDRPMGAEQQALVQSQIAALFASGASVEPQRGAASGRELVRRKLGVPEPTRLIFCALQVADDTATTTQAGDHIAYPEFVRLMAALARRLPAGTRLVYRNHPSSRRKIRIGGAIDAAKLHINDVVQAADLTLTYNSGVSVLSIAAGVPVIHFGPAPYAALGQAFTGKLDDLLRTVANPAPIDREAQHRYLHYLLNRFYSTAHPRDIRPVIRNGARASWPKRLIWDTVRVEGVETELGGTELVPGRARLGARWA